MPDAAQEMGAEVRVPGAVLVGRPVAGTVVEDGLQLVVLGASDVGMLVQDHAGGLLANALAHHARLVVLDGEALFQRNRRDVQGEPLGRSGEGFIARKDQVVGIAGVAGT